MNTHLSLSNETKDFTVFRNNPATTKAQDCHELETAETPESLSTVKQVLYCFTLDWESADQKCSKCETFKLQKQTK